jgi:hypothetical protein
LSGLLLPSALLVTIGLQALLALVLVHLETALLFEVAHESAGLGLLRENRLENTLVSPL